MSRGISELQRSILLAMERGATAITVIAGIVGRSYFVTWRAMESLRARGIVGRKAAP